MIPRATSVSAVVDGDNELTVMNHKFANKNKCKFCEYPPKITLFYKLASHGTIFNVEY